VQDKNKSIIIATRPPCIAILALMQLSLMVGIADLRVPTNG
jgi:hypothetical protein